jgi:hypothetical protein
LRQQLSSAQPTLDVERLVDAVGVLMDSGQIVDPALRGAFICAADETPGSGIRALVLAALGMEVSSGKQEAPAAAPVG